MSGSSDRMHDPSITVQLDEDRTVYKPGEALSGQCGLDPTLAAEAQGVRLSVLWYTEGKGDEYGDAHHIQELPDETGGQFDPDRPWRFETLLPPSPLSYEGVTLRVCWGVRVDVFLAHQEDRTAEVRFQLGEVSPGHEISE